MNRKKNQFMVAFLPYTTKRQKLTGKVYALVTQEKDD